MDLAPYIDHTLLKPDCSKSEITALAKEAMEHRFASICIPPYWVSHAVKVAEGSPLKICSVASFPFGYDTPFTIMASISESMRQGANEIDQVMNISAFKSGLFKQVKIELEQSARIVHSSGGLIKIIIETALLEKDEIRVACGLCEEAGVDFVKTSTGFAAKGALLSDVKLIKEYLNGRLSIKASGGIKTAKSAESFVKAGASRIGTSSGIKIIGKS